MASFSVDITDIVFAGGRTGYKTVTISNAPASGVTASLRGTNSTYFRVAAVETNRTYTISTKQANNTGSNRTATVRFTNNGSNADYVDVSLVQYSVTDMVMYVTGATSSGYGDYTVNVSNDMGSTSVILDVAGGNGASATVITGSTWLGSTAGTPAVSDTGFVMYNVTYITNTESERTGEVRYVAANTGWVNTLTVVQAGGASESLSVTPSSLNYNSGGGTSSIAVTYRGSTYNCDTTDVSSWVSVSLSTVMTGVLSGTVTCASNASTAQRSGNVVFSDMSGSINLPITQLGRSVTLSVSPSSLSYTSAGGTKTLAVTYDGTLSTNAASMPSWLTQSYVTIDSSHRTYTINASANTSSSSRSFNFNLQDDNMSVAVPISQEGQQTPTPQLSIDPTSSSVSSSSGTVAVVFPDIEREDITSVSYVISDDSWISFVERGNYRNLVFSYTQNNSSSSRTGTITFSAPGYTSSVYTIQQLGTGALQLLVSPETTNVGYSSGTTYLTVTKSDGSSTYNDITYTTPDSWIQQISGVNIWYTIRYDANYSSSSRTGTITFSAPGYESCLYVLNQSASSAPLVSFSLDSIEFNYLGGQEDKQYCAITYNGYSGAMYARYTGDTMPFNYTLGSWPVISSGTLGFECYLTPGSRNDSYTDLTGKFEFYTEQTGGYKLAELPVIWKGTPKNMTVLPDVIGCFNSSILKYRELPVYVTSTGDITVTAPSWIETTLLEENNTYKTYKIRFHSVDSTAKNGYVVFTSGGNSVIVNVYGKTAGSLVTPSPFAVPLTGGTKYMMFSSTARDRRSQYAGSADYPGVDSYPSFGTLYRYFYESDMEPCFTLFKYTVGSTQSDRSTTARIKYTVPGPSQSTNSFTIYQQAGVLGASPSEMHFSSNGGSDTVAVTFTGTLVINDTLPSWLSVTELSSTTGSKVYSITVLRNTGDTRYHNIIFQDDNGMIMLPVVQDVGSPAIIVTPSSNVVSDAGGTISVTVAGPDGMDYNISGSWVTLLSHSGSTYTFTYAANTSSDSRTATVTFSATGYLPGTYRLTQAAGGVLKVNPKSLKFHRMASTKKISFSNVTSGLVDYSITYIDDSGWLNVSGNGLLKEVSVVDNSGSRRRASIRFSDHNDSSNYVIVPVIQGGDGYDSIWMDTLYYPVNRDTDGSYYYRIVDANTNEEYFRGISAKPQGWGGNTGGIDIPRLVEDHIYSDFIESESLSSWDEMKGYCTVDVYNMTASDYPGVIDDTFKYWNDWSNYEEMYDYTVCLNDPINSRGCDNMIIPFCVYYDDLATFRILDTSKNGSTRTYTLPVPGYPFVMTSGSFNSSKTVEFRQDDEILFSYDMDHCGNGAFLYRNRFGGWDSFLIEGNIIKKDNYTKLNYRKKGEYNSGYSINSLHHFDEKYTDSIDINTEYEVYTGWLTDEESERLAYHLLSSPVVYFQNFTGDLFDGDTFTLIPVRFTNASVEYKKFRNGRRLVNYIITFEKANIQKVRR